MTEPKIASTITSRLKERLMTSATSVYRRRSAASDDPVRTAVQRALDKENTMPRDARQPNDDVQ